MMEIGKVLYCLCLLVAVGGKSSEEVLPEEVLGEELESDTKSTNESPEFPLIAVHGEIRCTGAVVNFQPKIIVTAAHCVYGVPNSALLVHIPNANVSISPSSVVVHPYYKPPSVEYDIAVIRFKRTVIDVTASELVKVPPAPDVNLTALSWNKQENLTMVSATLEDRKSCREKIGSHVAISSRVLCAKISTDSVVSGSPLIHPKGLLGIGSYYFKGNQNLPKVFTNIANSEIYSFLEDFDN